MYDIDNLTLAEAENLINYEKNPKTPLDYTYVYNSIATSLVVKRGKYQAIIVDNNQNISYYLDVLATPVNTTFTISLRVQKNNLHLIRFDFGEMLRHKNNYGKNNEYYVHGSHVHINSLPNKESPKDVIPISNIDEFKNLKTIQDAFQEFVVYTNIK